LEAGEVHPFCVETQEYVHAIAGERHEDVQAADARVRKGAGGRGAIGR
jgi:hypothetical protein